MLKGLQIEAEEFSVSNARNVLSAAEARLDVLDNLTKEKNRVQLESDIEAAKAKLSSDQSVLAEEQSKMAEIEDQIRKCIIYSPADGIVVYNNQRSGRGSSDFIVEEGAIVRERQSIIRLPDPSKMQVKALINESRVVRIQPGMEAKIRVSAFPNELSAQVLRVNKYAEPGSWFSSTVKQYAAYLEILNSPEAIRTGMSAEVRIFVEQLPDALQIPVHGVYEHQEKHYCLVKSGKNWETRPIKIGATNEKMVTITQGLTESDQVVLNPRNHLDLISLPHQESTAQDKDRPQNSI
jgi:RND family efflux transporter MFP subunit